METELLYEGRAAGMVEICREGMDTSFVVHGVSLAPQPHRIVAQGIEGELLLGVMDGSDRLWRRRFSSAMTEKAGRIVSVRAERCAEENGIPAGWRALQQGEFAALGRRCHGALCRTEGGLRALALPLPEEGPFPLPELFCFARVCAMQGARWAVFTFDEDDQPVMAEEN